MLAVLHVYRRLVRTPAFTAIAVLTLAICLGANLTILAVVDAILVRALPLAAPDRLALVYNCYPGAGVDHGACSLPNYFERRGAIAAFESVSIFQESSVIVGTGGQSRRVPTLRVSPEFFDTLGVPLAMGQPFTEEHFAYRADEVAILTDEFWRSHFNGERDVIGRTFVNDGAPVTVRGVLPAGFRFLSSRAQYFRPASHALRDRAGGERHSGEWNMVARLASGIEWRTAQGQMDAFNVRQLESDPLREVVQKVGYHTAVRPLHQDHVRQVRRTLVLLQLGVGFLLLIGIVNLGNLLLIRAHSRSQEWSVHLALGAGRWVIVRDVVAEVLLLVLAATAAGLLLAMGGLRLLSTLGADQLPLGAAICLNGRIALAGLGAAAVLALGLAGLVLIFSLRTTLAAGLKTFERGSTASRGAQRMHHGFVIAQVGLALVLLSGAGLLTISLHRVLASPVGFNPDHILAGRITFPWEGYTNQTLRIAYADRLVAAVRAIPGISSVAVNDGLPFADQPTANAVAVEGHESLPNAVIRAHHLAKVTGDYWRTMGIPLLRGRLLEDADRNRQPRACVVEEGIADFYWPNRDPISRRLSDGAAFDPANSSVVVGVVANTKQSDVTERTDKGTIYLPFGGWWPGSFCLVVRSSLPDAVVTPMIRQAVAQCDPAMPIDDLRSLKSRIDDTLVTRRSSAMLAGVFAGVALLLASLGTYGVLAYAVSQRQREIGVRLALGARPSQVLAQFFGLGTKLGGIGTVVGLPGAWAAGRAMHSMLFGVGPFPIAVMLTAALVLGGVVSLAAILPSRRAARVDPMQALRHE